MAWSIGLEGDVSNGTGGRLVTKHQRVRSDIEDFAVNTVSSFPASESEEWGSVVEVQGARMKDSGVVGRRNSL